MSKLMDELMAELNRVNSLEKEVDTTVKQLGNEVSISRTEKLKEIVAFCDRMHTFARQAGVQSKCGAYGNCVANYMWTSAPGRHRDGNHEWTNDLMFGRERDAHAWLGVYMTGSGDFWKRHYVSEYMDITDRSVISFIDGWDAETEQYIERRVTEEVKNAIARRIETATQKLKDANAEHGKYYGKDEILESYNLL